MALIATFVFIVVGLAVSRLVGRVQPYLAGTGAAGAALFVLNLLHVPFVVALALVAIGALWGIRRPTIETPGELVPTIIIAIVSAWLLFITAVVPLDDYDGRAFWLLKARAIAHEQQVDGPFFQQKESASPRNQYPLLLPIDAAVLMNIGGELDDRHVRWLYACFAIALALEVRRKLGAWMGAVALCLPEVLRAAGTASSDLALGAFIAAGFFAIVEGESPIQLGLWLACAVLTKNEGLPLALLLLAIGAFVFRKRIAIAAMPFAITAGALFLWRARVARSDEAPFARLIFDWAHHLGRLRDTLLAFAQQAIAFRNWGVFWIAVVIALVVLAVKRNWRALALAAGVLAPMIVLYATLIAVTDFDLSMMDGLARRLLTHLLGPALYAIAAVIGNAGAVSARVGGGTPPSQPPRTAAFLVNRPDPRQVVGERQHEEHAQP